MLPNLETLSPADAARLVLEQFPAADPDGLHGNRHDKRWIGLDRQHVYLIPGDETEANRLELEGWIIDQLHGSPCPVPRIVHRTKSLQVRTKISGVTLYDGEKLVFGGPPPANRYDPALSISKQGEVLALGLGEAIAACHQAFAGREGELEGLGLRRFRFDGALLRQSLQAHLTADRLEILRRAVDRYDLRRDSLVFCHGDLNHHNLCSDAATGRLNGIFDFGDCCLGARELDFKFLLGNSHRFLNICIKRYEEIAGVELSRESIADHHVLEAAANLVYAHAHPHHGIERCQGWLDAALGAL